MAVLRGEGVELGAEVAPVQSRAQSKEAARLLPGELFDAPPPLGGGGFGAA